MSSRFARNSTFSTIAGVSTALSGFLTSLIVARLVGPEGTGLVAVTLWLITVGVTAAELGAHATLSRFIPDLSAKNDPQGGSLVLWLLRPVLAVVGAGALATWAYAAWTASHSDGTWWMRPSVWFVVGAAFALQTLASFEIGRLRGLQLFDRMARLTVQSLLVQLVAVTGAALIWGPVGAVAGFAAGSTVPVVSLLRARLGSAGAGLTQALRRRALRYTAYALAGNITLLFVWTRSELFFLERSHGSQVAGLFSVALTFANLAAQGPVLLTGGLLPYFAERSDAGGTERMHAAVGTAVRLLAFVSFPLCFGAAAITPSLLGFLYGPGFAGAVPSCEIVLVIAAFTATGAVGSHLIFAAERSDFVFTSGLMGAALSIAAGLTIIPAFGLDGAAWSRALVQTFMVTVGVWFIWRRLGCPLPFGALGRVIGAATACAGTARLVIVEWPGPVGLLPAIAIGALTYGVAVRVLRALQPEDGAQLRKMVVAISGRLATPIDAFLSLIAPARPT